MPGQDHRRPCPQCGHPLHVHGKRGTCPTQLHPLGIYEADDEVHIDLEGACEKEGVEPTPANQHRLGRQFVLAFHDLQPGLDLVEVNHGVPGRPERPIVVVDQPAN